MSATPAHITTPAPTQAPAKAAPQQEESTTQESLLFPAHTALPSPLSGALPPSAIFSRAGLIQPKLTVGPVDDAFEKEADAVAEQVVNGSFSASANPSPPGNEKGPASIQRKCDACEEEDSVQRKPIDITPLPRSIVQRENIEDENGMMQAKALGGGLRIQAKASNGSAMTASPHVSSRIAASRGGGLPLQGPAMQQMQQGFGRDFGSIRIHVGSTAAELSSQLNAKAFTVGNDVFFGAGQYEPQTRAGQRLLAHELTHTVQQGGGANKIQRAWDAIGTNCPDVDPTRWLRTVTVHQEMPQNVTLEWDDGTTESAIASTGKGLCCGDTADAVTCDAATSTLFGTNCTPITTGIGYPISERKLVHNGWEFWNTFVPHRGIALHQHHTVLGEPLSHGCVRLNRDTARRIFCGSRQNMTRVKVEGFARPYCNSPNLQAEWMGDFNYAATNPVGQTSSVQGGIRETRLALRKAFGAISEGDLDTRIAAISASNLAAQIPRCASTAPVPSPANATPEEQRVNSQANQVSQFQLAFANETIALSQALRMAADLGAATTAVRNAGQGLWAAALQRAQLGNASSGNTPNIDDRPLYWARLRMINEIRAFTARWAITTTERQQLVDAFEPSSRGFTSVSFAGASTTQKRILISGFDPFGLGGAASVTSTNMTIADSNPSGAAVLGLNGQTINGSGSLSAYVQGVIFPVRYRDFDAGIVEGFFRPFLNGTTPVSMIMTISQGGGAFHIEARAGRNRSVSSFADNEGVHTPGTAANPVTPGGLGAGPQFLNTSLPSTPMSTVPDTSLRTTGATQTTETTPRAVTGTGGGFLSNEIFYRVKLLQTTIGGNAVTIPMGHLHVPNEDQMTREVIRDRIRDIIAAALPSLP
jgi:pyrrolidone-carboxylate peptidase